ncbi:hypothetical protein TbgDal_III5010 [Trypanosoma brucei gambiense DAL972]|uniref:Uncharacterized protein n=1 Tax=Trypanosoma brucei gambiense (strain MHOM/CI/86/DAL972) TaxID=679716 RepID=C9ZLF0_TRYB9|nr:hypothetical protein TbgDal_III5010 [Trypanosoma brucei gambiense DAL972]CBH10159.1 hypothetical protein TbgDal_III5010 [Trypanosoma brucei gambiense DAL972]|eukprot:XP_011772449.1 hypothetical protein TbgDal_III5010 [Trypanosoma brucei gambiense DAL972]
MVISIYKYINRQIPFAVSLSLSLFSFLNAPFHICEGKRGRRLCMWSISHVGMGLFSLFSFFLFFSLIIHHILPSMHLSFCFLYCYMIHFALSATNSALVRYFFFFFLFLFFLQGVLRVHFITILRLGTATLVSRPHASFFLLPQPLTHSHFSCHTQKQTVSKENKEKKKDGTKQNIKDNIKDNTTTSRVEK